MQYKAILFDLDGTLVDSITLYAEAVMQGLREMGVTVDRETFFDWYTRPLHLHEMLSISGLDPKKDGVLRARRDELYEGFLEARVSWLPGGKALMESIAEQKIPTALITGSWMSYVNAIDRKLDIKKYFPHIITAEEIHSRMKPDPHGLMLACERLGVDPTKCLYIGDQQFDIDAATAAGMPCILVRGAWTPKNAHGFLREVTGPEEITDLLRASFG
jgi:HAD superfamily hydrolase (TIGR01509 family)